jgi:hypothetical protein
MKFFLKKYYKFFLAAFALGFIVPYSYGSSGLFKADALTENYYAEYSEKYSLEEAIVMYHMLVNTSVNAMLGMLLDDNAAAPGYVAMPPSDEECSDTNVSTYCLAVRLNKELADFEEFAGQKSTELDISGGEYSSSQALEEALSSARTETNTLKDQMAIAADALDLTLAVYNQIQIVYPMHKELEDLIINLQDYNNNLAKIRGIVELYPSKFNGASTIQCK